MKKTFTFGLIIGLFLIAVFISGCGSKTSQTTPVQSAAQTTADNTATGNVVDVPADTVGDNPDTGAISEDSTDIPVTTSELPS